MPRPKKTETIEDTNALIVKLGKTYGEVQAEATKRDITVNECARQLLKEQEAGKAKRTRNLKGQKKSEIPEAVVWGALKGMETLDEEIKDTYARMAAIEKDLERLANEHTELETLKNTMEARYKEILEYIKPEGEAARF